MICPPSVIILQIHVASGSLVKAERNSPIGLNRDRSSSSFPLSPLFIILFFLLLALRAFLFLLQDLLVPADVILLGLGGGAFVFAAWPRRAAVCMSVMEPIRG